VVWMFRSFSRANELVPAVTAILERRLRHHAELAKVANPEIRAEMRARLDRLAAIQGRQRVVADLARDVRFHYFDEPLLEVVVAEEYARAERDLDALLDDPDGADWAERIDRLVACPQPLRAVLLRRWRGSSDAGLRRALLEIYVRRFYRIRELRDLAVKEHDGRLLGTADYDYEGKAIHLVTAYAPLVELPELSRAIAGHLAAADAGRLVVVDLALWRQDETTNVDTVIAEADKLLASCDFGRLLHRLDLTVTTVEGAVQAGMGFVILQQLLSYLPQRVQGIEFVLFALGATTYAMHPEGIVEYQKRRWMARVERLWDAWDRRRAGSTPESGTPAPMVAQESNA